MIEIREKNHCIIAAGSVDGVCTAAAVMRQLSIGGNVEIQVWFTQAFAVDKFDVLNIRPGSLVTLVGLAVNNKDEQMTLDFIGRILNAGHTIFAIIDEHDGLAWKRVIDQTVLMFGMLAIKPVSGKNTKLNSSGALLLNSLKVADPHVVELCKAADAADRMDFTPRLSGMVNQAIKSKIADDARRKYLVYHLAQGGIIADDIIAGWISEYDKIRSTHERLKKDAVCITKGIVRIDASGEIIDMTALLSDVYAMGARVVIVRSDVFNHDRGYKFPKVSIATSDKKLNVLSLIKSKVPTASGFTSKADIDPEYESVAIDAVLEGMVEV